MRFKSKGSLARLTLRKLVIGSSTRQRNPHKLECNLTSAHFPDEREWNANQRKLATPFSDERAVGFANKSSATFAQQGRKRQRNPLSLRFCKCLAK
jgi:hypothetical protein